MIENIIGEEIDLFAPPSGAYNDHTIAACNALGLQVIMWSKDTIDWRDHNTEQIFARATNDIRGGDLILMHPTAETLDTLPRILDYCISQGLIPSTVSQTLV